MGYTGTATNLMNAACDSSGNFVLTILNRSFVNGKLTGQYTTTQTTSCACCQFCCCITLDAGGTAKCGTSSEAIPGERPICSGSACTNAGDCTFGSPIAPTTRLKSCNNASADVASCSQTKDCTGTQCQCQGTGGACGTSGLCSGSTFHTCCDGGSVCTGICNWAPANDFSCTTPPGGC